jgi:hypothetical protein
LENTTIKKNRAMRTKNTRAIENMETNILSAKDIYTTLYFFTIE